MKAEGGSECPVKCFQSQRRFAAQVKDKSNPEEIVFAKL